MKLRVKQSTKRRLDNDEVKILFAGSIVDWDGTDAGEWIRVTDSDGDEFDMVIPNLEVVQEIVARPEIHINSSVTPEDVVKSASEEVYRRIAQVGEKFKNVSEEDSNNSPEPEWLMHVKALEQWALELEDRIGNLEDKVVKEEIEAAVELGTDKSYQVPTERLRIGDLIKLGELQIKPYKVIGLEVGSGDYVEVKYANHNGVTVVSPVNMGQLVTVVG